MFSSLKIKLKNVALPLHINLLMSSALATKTGIVLLKIVAKLPFGILYFISDILYIIVYRIIGYRKQVVQNNLANSFPEKTDKERKAIEKKFFRHLADIVVETIKMQGMREKDFRERMIFTNPELVNKYFNKSRSVVVLTMHYNNWEWSSCVALPIKHKILGVYKPLNNELFDEYLNNLRGKMGSILVPNSQVLRTVISAEKNNDPVFTWLAADQTPHSIHKFWMYFLNQETMFYPGPAAISKRFNHPLIFQKIEKQSRGKYVSSFELLFENPGEKSETEIMKAYIHKMEEVIRKKPEFYLWSHRRWKRKRPEGVKMQS